MNRPDRTYRTLCRLLSSRTCPEFYRTASIALTSDLGTDDWRLLASTAQQEGVAPLLYYSLNEASWPDDVPPEVKSQLRQAYYATTARNLLAYRELSHILSALNAQSPIPVILLKGAALAITIYSSIGLRPMGDLDLLVHEDRLAEAVARLKALGYIEPHPEMAAGLNVLAGHHVHLQGGQDVHVAVELHWTLIGGEHDWRSPSLPWFWQQTEEWRMEKEGPSPCSPAPLLPCSSAPLLMLTPTAHLLYLCAHLALQHGEAHSALRWFYDLHLLVEREGQCIQWDEVVARSREFRWAPAVLATLEGARERFGTRLPLGVLEALAEASDAQASRLVARRAEGLQTRATSVAAFASSLSPRARFRLLLGIAFPSPAYMRWRYQPRPPWLWPLCYPYRWLVILSEGLTTLWRMAKRKYGQLTGYTEFL